MLTAFLISPRLSLSMASVKGTGKTRMSSCSSFSPWMPPAPVASTRPQNSLTVSDAPPGAGR